MILVKVDHRRLEVRPILRGVRNASRETRLGRQATRRTHFAFRTVFRDAQADEG